MSRLEDLPLGYRTYLELQRRGRQSAALRRGRTHRAVHSAERQPLRQPGRRSAVVPGRGFRRPGRTGLWWAGWTEFSRPGRTQLPGPGGHWIPGARRHRFPESRRDRLPSSGRTRLPGAGRIRILSTRGAGFPSSGRYRIPGPGRAGLSGPGRYRVPIPIASRLPGAPGPELRSEHASVTGRPIGQLGRNHGRQRL
ncbi:hypothetical protein JST97_18570 [bacterium]|nr:hypothetical protein [bacterium]